jgi:pimeloyl-ACP methyl ester carboxylesterase
MAPMERIAYDEFGLFHENASEYGLPLPAPPSVRREAVEVAPGRSVSALLWGKDPQLVLLHGGAQNAHTWDTVLIALGPDVSAVAIDLPGHGHSDWRNDGAYSSQSMADDVAVAVAALAPDALAVVGMSMGGMTAMELAVRHPRLVRKLMLVDVTPGVNQQKAKAVLDFINGPQSFPSFEALLERTKEHNATRTEASLRRGILHNARQLEDGSWQWRYDRTNRHEAPPAPTADTPPELSPLWDDFAAVSCPMLLVRGSVSPVVDDEDEAEARRRQPAIRVELVDGAGHSVQGDRPLELAELIRSWALTPTVP